MHQGPSVRNQETEKRGPANQKPVHKQETVETRETEQRRSKTSKDPFKNPCWVFQVYSAAQEKFGLKTHTIFLGSHVYRILLNEGMTAEVPEYALSIAALFMAIKYEEIYYPTYHQVNAWFGRCFGREELKM